MPLPPTIRVKLSSEVAEAISLTPVVVQEMVLRDLFEQMLAVTGKDEPRIRETLLRGTMVSGATRFRWMGWEPDMDGVRELLTGFPDPDPARIFQAVQCTRAILRGGRAPVDIDREAASRKGLFQRRSFWERLMEVAESGKREYSGYSYRDRADRYMRELTTDEIKQIREAAGLSKFTTLRDQIRATAFARIELLTVR
jgi:hypothetical protein